MSGSFTSGIPELRRPQGRWLRWARRLGRGDDAMHGIGKQKLLSQILFPVH